jgi:hypothetical protein
MCQDTGQILAHPKRNLRHELRSSLQENDPVVKNKWDIPLHDLVNERGWFTFVDEEPLTQLEED